MDKAIVISYNWETGELRTDGLMIGDLVAQRASGAITALRNSWKYSDGWDHVVLSRLGRAPEEESPATDAVIRPCYICGAAEADHIEPRDRNGRGTCPPGEQGGEPIEEEAARRHMTVDEIREERARAQRRLCNCLDCIEMRQYTGDTKRNLPGHSG